MMIIALIVVVTALWVYYDCTKNNVGFNKSEKRNIYKRNASAEDWATLTLIIWIIGFPLYLISRRKLIEKAKANPVITAPKKKKIVFIVLIIVGLIMLVILGQNGSNQVDSVKNAYLAGREQTTIGNAFDTFFTDTSWELKESANKTRFVEFKGKGKGGMEIICQFVLKADGTFYIGYMGTEDAGLSQEEEINLILDEIYEG